MVKLDHLGSLGQLHGRDGGAEIANDGAALFSALISWRFLLLRRSMHVFHSFGQCLLPLLSNFPSTKNPSSYLLIFSSRLFSALFVSPSVSFERDG